MKRFAWAALLAPALVLAGCGTLVRDGLVHSYMDVPFDASATSPEIADLARRSLAGNKQAQLDLGTAFEEGRGVGPDLDKARKLYQLAAGGSGGPVTVYVPGVEGAAGRVTRIASVADRSGLPEAQVRLNRISEGKHRLSDNANQMTSIENGDVDVLCRLINSSFSESSAKYVDFRSLLLEELSNGNPSIVSLQWNREAIEKTFAGSPILQKESSEYQAFFISSIRGCDVSGVIKNGIPPGFNFVYIKNNFHPDGRIYQNGPGEIFDVTPLKHSGNRYSILINIGIGSYRVIDAYAIVWE